MWRARFADLKRFAAEHEEVRVEKTTLAVPAPLRAEFYALVERTQLELCAEALDGETVERALLLSEKLGGVISRIKASCGLDSFRLPPTLEAFLENPLSALAKPAFGMVIEGVQRGSSFEDMEAKAQGALGPFADILIRSAYESWVYYGIVLALEPVKFYDVYSPDTVSVFAAQSKDIAVAKQATSHDRRIPEAAFETRDGRVFGMKSEASSELDYYGGAAPFRDNSAGGNTPGLLAHRVLLLYRFADVSSVSPVVDKSKHVSRPCDLMVEVLAPDDLVVPAFISTFVSRANGMNVKRPIQVVTFDEESDFPEGMLEDESVAAVERRIAGLDESALAEIATCVA